MSANVTSPRIPEPDGLVIQPIRALRYANADLAGVLSPPYDVLGEDDVRRLEARDPHNVVRLILPRDRAGDPDSRYAVAAQTLASWQDSGVLTRDQEPTLYVYEERAADGHVQRGFLTAVALARPETGVILPHENTMGGVVADRLALMAATRANLEPIFLVYDGGGAATAIVRKTADETPLAKAVTDDGVGHRLWAITDPGVIDEVSRDLYGRRATIADGHHRYATYLRYQEQQHAAGAGAGPWDFGLVFLVDGTEFGPQVHAIHRVIHGLPIADAVALARQGFDARELSGRPASWIDELTQAGRNGPAYVLASGDQSFLLTGPSPDAIARAMPAERSAAWRALDVTIAHRYLISTLLGIDDNEHTVGFEHDVDDALEAARRSGGTVLLFNPTPLQAVADVARSGEPMPRKSTLFVPKPASGLVIRPID